MEVVGKGRQMKKGKEWGTRGGKGQDERKQGEREVGKGRGLGAGGKGKLFKTSCVRSDADDLGKSR